MNFKKLLLVLLILAVVFIFLFFFIFKKDNVVVKINNAEFDVELARTKEDWYKGLSGREELGENQGMLFIFDNYKKREFIMRDMNFSLDVVWIKDNEVFGCEKDVQILASDGSVSLMRSKDRVNMVLEINAGKCNEFGIKNGDIVDIKLKQ